MKLQHSFVLWVGLAVLGTGAAAAQEFDTFDVDMNRQITAQEARNLDDSVWDLFDTNNDDIIEAPEFNAGVYNWADVDDSGVLDRNEVGALDTWGYDTDFDAWDTDRNGFLSESELGAGVGDATIYADWDLDDDNRLNDREFEQGYFNVADADRSGSLSQDEFDRIGRSGAMQASDRRAAGTAAAGYDADALPQSASPLPLIALIGLASLGGALGLRARRRR